MVMLTDIILCQKPIDVTNKMTRYKSDGMAVNEEY
jgi:hypothetical protein